MDTQSHFFSDCVDLDDANPFSRGLECDGTDNNNDAPSFQLFNSRVSINGSPMPTLTRLQDMRSMDMKPALWDGFTEPDGVTGHDFDQHSLFGEEGPGGRIDEQVEASIETQINTCLKSQPSTRRNSSSKSTSRRSSKSASTPTDVTFPDQEPPKKKARRANKGAATGGEEEEKRNKFLERNRIAASKCREKKKHYVSQLEENKSGLEHQHALLQMEYNSLLGEVGVLKHQLMAHAKCNDPNIDKWISNEARRFVQTSNELFGQAFPFATAVAAVTGQDSHSRNPSTASTCGGVTVDGLVAAERRESMAYSHASPLQTSPTETSFSAMTSPFFKTEPDINYDHMPDSMFASEQAGLSGG